MRRESGRVIVALLALVGAAAAIEGILLARLAGRVAELEGRLGETEAAGPALTPLALGGEVKNLADRVDGIDRTQERLLAEIGEASGRVAKLEAAAGPGDVPADGAAPAAMAGAKLEETVGKLVDEKLAKLPKGGGGEWKPSLDELSEELELTDYQETRTKRILDDAKHELYQLAGLKRPDGTAKIDDLVAAVSDPVDPDAAVKQWFASLFTDRIPGREEPYISEILRIRNATEKSLREVLDEEQGRRLGALNLDYLGVKTGYDPFAEHLQSSFR